MTVDPVFRRADVETGQAEWMPYYCGEKDDAVGRNPRRLQPAMQRGGVKRMDAKTVSPMAANLPSYPIMTATGS